MRRDLIANTSTKECLIAEYCDLIGGRLPVTEKLVDAAVRHMHKILLCDVKPPWVD